MWYGERGGGMLWGSILSDLTHSSSVIFTITGGGEKARARQISRNKMLPRERISKLLDAE